MNQPKLIPSKEVLKQELIAQLEDLLLKMSEAQRITQEGATHSEAKSESDKDTRATEQSYLARGQAMRVEDLRNSIVELQNMRLIEKPISIQSGALVRVVEEDDDEANGKWLFFLPHGGGHKLASNRVQVITPRSPLGELLLAREVGDFAEHQAGGKVRELEVAEII